MKSKRKSRRLTIVGIGFLRTNSENKSHEIYLTNFSKGGVGIYLHKPMKAGTRILITFTYRDTEGERRFEDQPGMIVWCSRCGSVYATGIRFDHLPHSMNIPSSTL